MSSDSAQVPLWEALYEMKEEAAIVAQMDKIWPYIDAKNVGSVDIDEIFEHFNAKDTEMANEMALAMPEGERAAFIADYKKQSTAENAMLKENCAKNAEGRVDKECMAKCFVWRLCVKGM